VEENGIPPKPLIELATKENTMSSAEIRGRFVWHELMTTDTTAAGAFYPRVAGWKSQPFEKMDDYTLWVGGKGPMGGLMPVPVENGESPASQWVPYIGTPDIGQTIARARELGAQVMKDVQDIPDAGQFAILLDPQGVMFAIYSARSSEGSTDMPPDVGDFSWHELATSDPEEALEFYTELFGWDKSHRHDMGEMGYYQLFARNGRDIGGIYRVQHGASPHWLSYVRVSDVDKAANATKAAGGRVLNGPMEVPGGDWIAQLMDPQGVAFAVHQVKKAAKSAPAVKSARKAAKPQPRGEAVESAPARKSAPAKRAAVRRPGAKRSTPARKTAAARKRASSRRVAKSSRAKPARRAPAKRAGAGRRRVVARKRVLAKKKATRRLRARKRR